jgi:hypothetical protein
MPRIICRYDACIFWRDSLCTAKEMEYDPDQGCLTAQDRDEFVGVLEDEEEDWDEEEKLEPDEEEETDEFAADELEDDEEDELFGEGDLEEEVGDDEEDF